MKVALVHDDLVQRGGAERVVLSLSRLFPDAPIYTTVYDEAGTFPEFADRDVRTTFLQHLPHRGGAARALLPLYPAAVRALRPRRYDVVISSSSRFAHGVDTGGAPHLCYCYNPARFLYQGDDYFGAGGPVPAWLRPLLGPLLSGLRRWDAAAARRPDQFLTTSKVVAGRILATYGRAATVVNPPVDVARIAGGARQAHPALPDGPYYLVVSRLLAYKRVELAAATCAARGARLVVVGEGPARSEVERVAGAACELRGSVGDDELLALLHGCRAVLHPGEEDFGYMPLEANAAGKPVVTVARAGALETVIDGTTGVLFRNQTVEGLSAALDRLESRSWDGAVLRAHAEQFDERHFHRAIRRQVEQLLQARHGTGRPPTGW